MSAELAEARETKSDVAEPPVRAGWRIKVAFALFLGSPLWPVVPAILSLAGVPGITIGAVSGTLFVLGEAMALSAIAIAGKDGFEYIKAQVKRFFRSYGPPRQVSRTRYLAGLSLFMAPVVVGFAMPYLGHYVAISERVHFYVALACDLVFLVSLFVLGGEFWSKMHALFVHSAQAVFPANRSATAS